MANTNFSPDYSQYSIDELEDVLVTIDKAQFPERYERARTMLLDKRQNSKRSPNTEKIRPQPISAKIKWSEQPWLTRIMSITFALLALSVAPTVFYRFMVAKSWTENTSVAIWLLAPALAYFWFICLKHDSKLLQRLEASWRGQLSLVIMPLLFVLLAWWFIDKSLPLGLHMISAQQEVRYDTMYRKRNSNKRCRYRVEILETDQLEKGDLCLTEKQQNSLPEKAQITILGSRSHFGMTITGYQLKQRQNGN